MLHVSRVNCENPVILKKNNRRTIMGEQAEMKEQEQKQIVELDEERKAAMVSNLLVVLCGNHDAQPVVNSGSRY